MARIHANFANALESHLYDRSFELPEALDLCHVIIEMVALPQVIPFRQFWTRIFDAVVCTVLQADVGKDLDRLREVSYKAWACIEAIRKEERTTAGPFADRTPRFLPHNTVFTDDLISILGDFIGASEQAQPSRLSSVLAGPFPLRSTARQTRWREYVTWRANRHS